MSEENISITEWNSYLDDLYSWIQEKYKLFSEDTITQDEYNEHLQYYMKEKERIEKIIESIEGVQEESVEQTKPKSSIQQTEIEQFFGVKLEEELHQIDENPEPVEDTDGSKNQDVWKYVQMDHAEGFDTRTPGEEESPHDYQIRILLIGDSAVGRTSLRRAWMGKHFVESHLTTIGASIESKVLEIGSETYDVSLTDLGGQDFYSGLRRNFYRNIDGAILVFDLTRPNTFRRLDFWIKEMYRELKTLVPFILVGNKKDSPDRKISENHGVRASAQFSRTTLPKFRVRYMETSAKSGDNVDEIFEMICLEVRDIKYRSTN